MKRLLLVAALSACPSTSPGTQGPEGPQGPMGALGLPGPKGDRGDVGPKGDQGVQGVAGMTGPQGQQGPMGQVLVIDGGVVTGPRGVQGVSVLLRDAGACVIVSYEDGGSAYRICQGPAGADGAPGAMGSQGAQGAQGVQGAQGLSGAQGTQGLTGSPGPQGPAGPQGPQGPVGPALLLDGGALTSTGVDHGFEFAGFTAALYDGNLGGPIGAHQKCAAEFPGAHICTDREYEWTGASLSPSSANGFWMDYSQYSSSSAPNYYPRDVSGSYSCNRWRSNNGPNEYSEYTDQQGVRISPAYNVCNVQRHLACCRSPHAKWFRGFTSTVYDGNLGGPIGAHQRCAAQYAGSHLCTNREYQWAGSGVSPPSANGFWTDYSQYSSSSAPNYYPRDVSGSYSCNRWRSNNGPNEYSEFTDVQGVQVSPAYNVCNVQRALACCGS